MKFCSQCGNPVSRRVPAGDTHARFVCDVCATIHYENPKVIVGCLAEWEDRVLLCRRAIEPRHGLWTLPAGFLENDETTAAGAAREALEEANAVVRLHEPYTLYNLPHINQIYLIYRGVLDAPVFSPGMESLDVALFREEEIPWATMAFGVITVTLRHFFEDRRRGRFPLHSGELPPSMP